jgi:hypothetical protein
VQVLRERAADVPVKKTVTGRGESIKTPTPPGRPTGRINRPVGKSTVELSTPPWS